MIVILDDFNISKFFLIIKYLLKKRNIFYVKKKNSRFYYFYELLFFKKVKPISWNFRKLQSKNNMNLHWYLLHYELEPVLLEMIEKIFKKTNFFDDKYVRLYLLRELANNKLFPYINKSILEIIFTLNAINILLEKKKISPILYIVDYFPWNEPILNYARKIKIHIIFTKLNVLYYSIYFIFISLFKKLRDVKKYFTIQNNKIENKIYDKKNIVIEHSLAINNPINFMKNSHIHKENCILVNRINNFHNNDIKLAKKAGYRYLDIKKLTIKNLSVTKIYSPYSNFFENIYLNNIFNNYFIEKRLWKYIFTKLNAKTYLSSQFMNKNSIPTSAALSELQGTSIFYASSYYERANPQTRFICDIYLSPGKKTVNNISENFTYFKYLLPFGYTNSYKIDLMKDSSKKIKKFFKKNNVKKIISFYDQGEVKDDMFSMGYDSSLEGYKFLIQKLLENEWLGLIIKPKKPGLLKDKLLTISNMINLGLKTERLILISESSENHVKNFDNPPCESAMVADLAIHDTMVSATAGIEAYLSNTKTIFFDRFNFFESRFYKNTKKIVYNDWDKLWDEVLSFFDGNNNNFGNWDKEVIDQIDMFRDNSSDNRIAYITQKIYEYNNHKNNYKLKDIINDYKKHWKINE